MPTTTTQGFPQKIDSTNEALNKVPTHPYFGSPEQGADVFNPETTRWAVFKVKKRASMNYNSVIGKVNLNGYE